MTPPSPGRFRRNFSVLLAGTALGQAATIVLSPLLTRLYPPAAYGVLSVYTSLLLIVGMLGSLRYEMAIPIARSDEEAADLLALCGLVLAVTTVVVTILALLASPALLELLALDRLGPYRLLIPFGFACLGGASIIGFSASREAAFGQLARANLLRGVLGPVSQIGFGLAGAGPLGLIVGFVVGQTGGMTWLLRHLVEAQRGALGRVRLAGIRAAARRYRRFPLVWVWGAMIEAAVGTVVPYLMLSSFYSYGVAGFLFLSDRVVGRPLLMVSSSLLQVYVGEVGRAVAADPALLRRRFYQVVWRQFGFAVAWITLVNLTAPWLYPLAFGRDWAGAVPYLRALSVWFAFNTVLSSVSQTLQLLERQMAASLAQAARLALCVAVFVGCVQAGLGPLGAVWGYCITQAICCVAMLGLIAWSIEQVWRTEVQG